MLRSAIRLLRSIACVALLVAPIVANAASAAIGQLHPWTGPQTTPPLELLSPAGKPLSLAQLRGKVVLVNFWATWCEPCVAEMPALQRLRQQLAPDGFEVLGVNYQEGPARIGPFVEKLAIRFPIVRDDDGAAARAWDARVFPASFLIDRAGRRRYFCLGEVDWTSPALINTIRALIAEPLPR